MPFKFGNTYKEDCDSCIDDYLTTRNFYDTKATDLKRQVASCPRLTPISQDPEVRDKLNLYRDTHPSRPILVGKHPPQTTSPTPTTHSNGTPWDINVDESTYSSYPIYKNCFKINKWNSINK